MAGHGLALHRTISSPVADVWAVLTDLERAPEHLTSVTRVEIFSDGPYAVGTRWRETRKVMGKEGTEEMVVTANDPLRSTVIEASSGGMHYRTTFTLHPVDEATTQLRMEVVGVTGEQTGLARLATAVMGRLGLRITRTMMQKDLDDIATAVSRR